MKNKIMHNIDESKVRRFILDHIDTDGYENQTLPDDPVLACFEIYWYEHGSWGMQHRPAFNIENDFVDWLMGLPSCMTVPFYFTEERNYLRDWLITPNEEMLKDDDRMDDRYWHTIATVFFKMKREAAKAAGLPALFD